MARDKTLACVIVVEETEDQCIRMKTLGSVGQCLSQIIGKQPVLATALCIPNGLPGPASNVIAPVVGGIETIFKIKRLARCGFRQQKQIWLDAFELSAPGKPELRAAFPDRPGSIHPEAIHMELAHPVRKCLDHHTLDFRVVVVEIW